MALQKMVNVFLNNFVGLSFKEKRKHDRRQYGANAMLIVRNREYSCLVQNISNSGALLVTDIPLPIRLGQLVEIQIPFSNGTSYVEKSAKIKRIQDDGIAIKFLW